MTRTNTTTMASAMANAKPRLLKGSAKAKRALKKRTQWLAAAKAQIALETYWCLHEETQPAQEIAAVEVPKIADYSARDLIYDVPAHVVLTQAPEVVLERLLGATKEQRAAAMKDAEAEVLLRASIGYEAAHAGSAEARDEVLHPLMAPAASQLEAALGVVEGPTWSNERAVYHAAHDLWCGLGTLADRWPRKARRTESGAWMRSGVVTETLDAVCAAFERRWERSDRDLGDAQTRLRDAERANKQGEIDVISLTRCEDDVVERQEQLEFYHQLFWSAKSAYALLVGTGWQTSKKVKIDRASALGLAGATLMLTHEQIPPQPAMTQRVIVAGGGDRHLPELEQALEKLVKKYPSLTLYATDYDRGPADQVARWALKAGVQLIRCKLDRADGNRGAFRRNERMMQLAQPHGVVLVGPLTHGPTGHLADLAAAAAGVGLWDLRADVKTPPVTA